MMSRIEGNVKKAMRKQHLLTPLLGAAALSASLIGGYGHAHANGTLQPAATPPTGTWKALTPRSMAMTKVKPYMLPPDQSGCPSGSEDYPGGDGIYNCYGVSYDGEGHGVWIREGYNDANNNGFGYTHFYNKHNINIGPVEAVIANNAYGIEQPNGRYLYGEYFVAPQGEIDQYVNIYEDRSGAPVSDGNEKGVITAYCEDQNGNEESRCPDWVNATL